MRNRRPRSLTQAAAPIFLYLTTFRRNAASTRLGPAEVRDQLKRRIESFTTTCELDTELGVDLALSKYVLVVLCDAAIMGSNWPHAREWAIQPLERDYFNTFQGGRRFYEIANQVLGDIEPKAARMAGLMFQCMGLGFQGELMGRREDLVRFRRQLYEKARLSDEMSDDKLTPGAYGANVTKEQLFLPMGRYMRMLAISAGLLVFTVIGLGRKVAADQSELVTALATLERLLEQQAVDGSSASFNEPTTER